MQVQEIKYPKLTLGWLERMVLEATKYAFTLPGGKILVPTPTINVSHSDYLKLCPSISVNCNDGQNQAGVPRKRKAVMAGVNYIKRVGKAVRDFDDSDVQKAIDSAVLDGAGAGVGYDCFTSQVGERTNSPNDYYCYDFSSIRTKQVRQGISAKIRSLGGDYFDEYDGHSLLSSFVAGRGYGAVRDAMRSGQDAYNFLSTTPLGFHSHSYWLEEEWRWRSGIIQTYWDGTVGQGKLWVYTRIASMYLTSIAKAYKGITDSKNIAFGFPMGSDFFPNSVYRRPLPDGYMQGSHQSKASPSANIIVHLAAMVMIDGIFSWQTTAVTGQEPLVLLPDGGDSRPQQKLFSSTNYERVAATAGAIDQQTARAGYPANPCGYEDLGLVSAYLYGKGYEHTGSTEWRFVQVKRSDGSMPTPESTYLHDQELAKAGVGIEMGSGNKRWLFFHTMHRECGIFATETVRVGGQDFTFEAEGGTAHCFNLVL